MAPVSLEQLDRDIKRLRVLVDQGTASTAELDALLDLRTKLEDASPDDWDAYRFLIEHLPPNDAGDLVMILKGHLLLEFMIRSFVQRRMLNPDALPRLSSYIMICLAEALCLPNEEPVAVEAIERTECASKQIRAQLESGRSERENRSVCRGN